MNKLLSSIVIIGFFGITSFAFANPKEIDVSVKGMMCQSCAKKIKTKLEGQSGVEKVNVNLRKGLVQVVLKDGNDLSDDQIAKIVNDTDYKVGKISRQ